MGEMDMIRPKRGKAYTWGEEVLLLYLTNSKPKQTQV